MLTYITLIVSAYAVCRLGGLADDANQEGRGGLAVWYIMGLVTVVALVGLFLNDLQEAQSSLDALRELSY